MKTHKNFKIRMLEKNDFEKGFFDTLSNLSDVNLDIQKAKKLFDLIKMNPMQHIFVAEIDSNIIGTITIILEQKFIHGGGMVCHIEDLSVKKNLERQGIGKSLIKYAINFAKDNNCYKIILDSSKENIEFYKKIGFKNYEYQMRFDLEN